MIMIIFDEFPVILEDQLVYLLMDYMFPAPVAVGNTLNYLWCYLLMQPEIQTKVQNELDQVVGRGRLPNLDDRKK